MKSVKYNCEVCGSPIYGKKTSCSKENDHSYSLFVLDKKLLTESIIFYLPDSRINIEYKYFPSTNHSPYIEIEKIQNGAPAYYRWDEEYKRDVRRIPLNPHKPMYFRSLQEIQDFLLLE